jgi:exodeoxyribonuclease V alpha subunit
MSDSDPIFTELSKLGVPIYVLQNLSDGDMIETLRTLKTKTAWDLYNRDVFTLAVCSKIAEKSGHLNYAHEKCKTHIEHILDMLASQGHCYAMPFQLRDLQSKYEFREWEVERAISSLVKDGKVYRGKTGNIFANRYFNAEKKFANMLRERFRPTHDPSVFNPDFDKESYKKLTKAQQGVVDFVGNNSLTVLTGLPGTGKTTTIKAIVDVYGEDNVVLLAPTGKAAARMSELCNMQATTLHSFFFQPQTPHIARTIENCILIIDELSMLDVEVAGWIAQGIKESCNLVLVGDPDQLPSVGPGQILSDILKSDIECKFHLDQIMRQKPGSLLRSAHSIHDGRGLVMGDGEVTIYIYENQNLGDVTKKIYKDPNWNGAQFLSILKEKGSVIVNKAIHPFDSYAPGDKVIHTKNNKNLGVNNGETGVVKLVNIDPKKSGQIVTVEYANKIIDYDYRTLPYQLELAYCITVHKAQGSEFNKVVLFVQDTHLATKNLIYTGLTRAKSKILIVAPTLECLNKAISSPTPQRNTSLKWLINKEWK